MPVSMPEIVDPRNQRQPSNLRGLKGLRHGPKEVMDRLYQGEIVDPGAYYFRTSPYFETSSENYSWMNRICSIAIGSLSANVRTLDVFQAFLTIYKRSC